MNGSWVKLHPTRALNAKLRRAGLAARGLDDAAICQVASDMSDGYIAAATVEMLALAHGERKWKLLAAKLVAEGRWSVAEGGWMIHDYLEFNPSKAEWEAELDKRRTAGRKGGQARARPSAQAHAQACASANAQPLAEANPQANTQAVSFRFEKHPPPQSSSKPETPPAVDRSEDDDDRPTGIVKAAMLKLASRALDVTPTPVANRQAWLAKVAQQRYDQHKHAIASLDLGYFTSGDDLANHLEPPAATSPKPGPLDATRAADETNFAHNDATRTHPCETCQGTGWAGETDVRRCENCHGTGIAA